MAVINIEWRQPVAFLSNPLQLNHHEWINQITNKNNTSACHTVDDDDWWESQWKREQFLKVWLTAHRDGRHDRYSAKTHARWEAEKPKTARTNDKQQQLSIHHPQSKLC